MVALEVAKLVTENGLQLRFRAPVQQGRRDHDNRGCSSSPQGQSVRVRLGIRLNEEVGRAIEIQHAARLEQRRVKIGKLLRRYLDRG